MTLHMTAGAKSLKAASDSSYYDGIEVAEAQLWDAPKQVIECAHRHSHIFDEEEYFVVMVRASDPLIHGLVRQKFYAYMYLPSPRPEQAVWLYNKITGTIKFMWSLPPAKVMAAISEAQFVSKKWERTKGWCQAFFDGRFWQHIRDQHKINHLSEHEYLLKHKPALIQASGDNTKSLGSDTFDFSKITVNKVVDLNTPSSSKSILDRYGKAQNGNGNVASHKIHQFPVMS